MFGVFCKNRNTIFIKHAQQGNDTCLVCFVKIVWGVEIIDPTGEPHFGTLNSKSCKLFEQYITREIIQKSNTAHKISRASRGISRLRQTTRNCGPPCTPEQVLKSPNCGPPGLLIDVLEICGTLPKICQISAQKISKNNRYYKKNGNSEVQNGSSLVFRSGGVYYFHAPYDFYKTHPTRT